MINIGFIEELYEKVSKNSGMFLCFCTWMCLNIAMYKGDYEAEEE